ncbi:hypothetical protein AA0242T_1141 [Acetobacter aceti NRIC 0242]|uniref:Zinc finger/thioredoxin putative domain-containing protein n=2 Tax=Acetobacter aceti TaxID=435 RepID=A0AB33IHA2_ACEAC|nr:hypothetical protein EDC15_10749 [Acetobacter aceti NBRC 14818]BCK77535.1 hypothetical protein EMQ_3141 [Acetobacter aceti NBRC 14818]GAN56826.1 hypothetical protein Abac_010_100 [Acetobacter aceti NBRC 14818]GBO80439.1 hypothetical protein AA0242T_1141 [Acetobacter aceti NRIC 0242]
MLIVCPSCGIKYNVPVSYLMKDRTLKCAGCGASWFVKAVPPSAAETADPPSVVPALPPVQKPVVPQPDEQVATSVPAEPAKPALPDTAAVSEETPASSAASEQPKAPEETVSQPDHQFVAAASEPTEAQAEAPATSVAPEAHPAPSVAESQSQKPEAPLPDEHSAARQVEPVKAQEEQTATPPATAAETVEAEPSPVAGENSTSVPREEPLQSEPPVQNEEQEIRQEQAAEPAEVPEPVAAVPDVPAAEEAGQPDRTEEQKSDSESHSEAPPAEVQEPVAPQPAVEPDEEKFSTLSESPTNQHFSTRITPLQDKTHSNSQGSEASEDGYEKPFSFLDLPIESSPVAPRLAEPAAPEKKVVYRSIWDDEPESSASQPTGFGTKPEEDPHEWREKDLDEHFSVENTRFAGTGYQDENLVESSDNRDHLKDISGQPHAEHEAEAFRDHVEKSDEQSADDLPSPVPQDGAFDDVITRLRAARNNPGGQESAQPHISEDTEQTTAAPWVPVWDRVSESDEGATPASAEEHHEAVWDHAEAAEEKAPSEHVETVEEAKTEEEPAAAPRYVTPAIDISSRLRSDVLKRVEHADDGPGSFLESPAFWRKAWIASGVGAVVVLAACTHWFGALRHLWPALNLL